MCIFQPFYSKKLVIHFHHQFHMILRRFLKLNWDLNCMFKAISTNFIALNEPKNSIWCIFSLFPANNLRTNSIFNFTWIYEVFKVKLNFKQFNLFEFQQLFRIITNLTTNRIFCIFQTHFSKKIEILFHLQFHLIFWRFLS